MQLQQNLIPIRKNINWINWKNAYRKEKRNHLWNWTIKKKKLSWAKETKFLASNYLLSWFREPDDWRLVPTKFGKKCSPGHLSLAWQWGQVVHGRWPEHWQWHFPSCCWPDTRTPPHHLGGCSRLWSHGCPTTCNSELQTLDLDHWTLCKIVLTDGWVWFSYSSISERSQDALTFGNDNVTVIIISQP